MSLLTWIKYWYYTGCLRHPTQEKPIVVVVPSYNNAQWYKRNLDSLLAQQYTNFKIIYIDDCSPDGTGILAQDYVVLHPKGYKVTLVRNKQRVGVLANVYNTVHTLADDVIVVTVDGDDWLAHDYVLALINSLYEDSNVWLTYGNYRHYGPARQHACYPLPKRIIAQRSFRRYRWVYSQLRTFYAGLFKRIKKEDLLHNGDFYSVSGDAAIMFPMLEMAGDRFKFISQKIYVYNVSTPLNDFKVHYELQARLADEIRRRPVCSELTQLF